MKSLKSLRREELRPGMILGQDIYNLGNHLIAAKGTVLTDNIITRLQYYSVLCAYVEDDVPKETAAEPEIHSWVVDTKEFQEFQKQYDSDLETFRNDLNDIVGKNAGGSIDHMYEGVQRLASAGTGLNVLEMMRNLRKYDDSTYTHAINVALICNIMARWLGFSEQEVELASMCGLMHDIGKLKIPSDIIKKPGSLTDEEYAIIKNHTIEGYRILSDRGIHQHICNSALMHHERCDGTGYPYKLHGSRIDHYAKLVAIADIYDAMTARRVYRGPMSPFDVIQIFEDEGLSRYDTRYIITFLQRVADSYMNAHVRLNDGREGRIIYINRQEIGKPTVQCGSMIVDLRREKGLKIAQML